MEEQAEQHQTWWQKNKQVLAAALGVIIVLIVAFALAVNRFGWDWIGFNGGYGQITTTSTSQGITIAIVKPPGKTLWDLLQLLIVPAVLAIGVFWLNQIQKGREERATKQRDKTEHEIALDNQRDAALQGYIDSMSELFLHEKLRDSAEEDEVRKIARVRTLTILRGLDPIRKTSVLQFLHESGLIDKAKKIIDLLGADLHEVNLGRANLGGTDLHRTGLHGAYLREANLGGIDLSEANLSEANLSGANLSGADLHGADLLTAFLDGADLHEADLHWSNLTGAFLTGADLSGANLSNADLSRANLTWAELNDAVLTEVDLSRANMKDAIGITKEQLEQQAKSLEGATMPDGSIHP